ncbi:hypothetical protein HRbin30_00596 [bacterium HR30]|nr:hypothetical protein HRbin30_00596 [bacterium HR30]
MRPYDVLVAFRRYGNALAGAGTGARQCARVAITTQVASAATTPPRDGRGARQCARVSIRTNAPGRDHRFSHVVVRLRTRAVNMECESHAFAGIALAMLPQRHPGSAGVVLRTTREHMCRARCW